MIMLPMRANCWLCQLPLALQHQGICSFCLRTLALRCICCPCCGQPSVQRHRPCGRCLRQPPLWEHLIFVSHYQPPLSLLVTKFKFSRVTALAALLARLIVLSWLRARRDLGIVRPDLILAVPLHQRRTWHRGFNQTDLLARPLARWTGICYRPEGLRRVRAGKLQHTLNALARRRNLRGAFSIEIAVQGRHIALIDDVVTTGSTVTEITRMLMQAGAASVQIWCLCRTL